MRRRRKLIGPVLSCLMATGIAVGPASPAHAEVHNPQGYMHLKNFEGRSCMMADGNTAAVQQWRCLNAPSEEWAQVPVSISGGGTTHFLFASHWTTMCAAVPGYPASGTKVVQLPCDVNDVRQYWLPEFLRNVGVGEVGIVYRFRSLLGSLCLEIPDGNGTQGVQLQVRGCASQDPGFDPLGTFDYHREQWWYYVY